MHLNDKSLADIVREIDAMLGPRPPPVQTPEQRREDIERLARDVRIARGQH